MCEYRRTDYTTDKNGECNDLYGDIEMNYMYTWQYAAEQLCYVVLRTYCQSNDYARTYLHSRITGMIHRLCITITTMYNTLKWLINKLGRTYIHTYISHLFTDHQTTMRKPHVRYF